MRLLVSLLLVSLLGCVQATAQMDPGQLAPNGPPLMRLFSPEGYGTNWWIWEEDDGSCNIEFDIVAPNKAVIAHHKVPCQMFFYFFHAIQLRKSA